MFPVSSERIRYPPDEEQRLFEQLDVYLWCFVRKQEVRN